MDGQQQHHHSQVSHDSYNDQSSATTSNMHSVGWLVNQGAECISISSRYYSSAKNV